MSEPQTGRRRPCEAAVDKVPVAEESREAPTLGPMNSVGPPTPPGLTPESQSSEEQIPERIGRFRVVRLLGQGGFGAVYLAYDGELKRQVAIKVPHRQRLAKPEDAEAYLAEARVLASLDHPHIVPVHDVGRTADGLCFVVAKFIQGTDLAQKVKDQRLSFGEAAELTATIAYALHHAHKRGLVHRDVKPANILLDTEGRIYLADFGLALKEEDYGKGGGVCGTPSYMSPEQANGEGHRVDGRSDIFSLGSVLYELLTGRCPFRGETPTEVIVQISIDEPRPPRQVDDTIPKELERICLKALAKKSSDRYTTAKDLADDLRHFLEHAPETEKATLSKSQGAAPATPLPSMRMTPTSDHQQIKIVPKGLRSFDEHDADFFLELLPGPRGRDGLPDSLRFWKTRIEEMDPDQTFSVGLIYGPSGCGKSSLVKAGLLPRLSDQVIAVYVEATVQETETRLLKTLRKRCPALPGNLSLKETLAALRRGQGIPVGTKVLIVLDQFEQWLHANPLTPTLSPREREKGEGDLVQALRQCDGGRVQCVVMVRDDFWLAVSRFLRELEVRLVEGQNSALVDLFPLRHAEKVLAAFGRAFGVLPENPSETSKEQKDFLTQAVSGLAQEGKVISVRLALFAEMMKSKAWTVASLKAVGGTEGVGVTFLEETFSSATAPPEHRYHQKAARADLKILLPETGSDIKGHMRSYAELLEASGYGSRAKDFEDLIRILDNEIRLITPTDPEGVEGGGWSVEGEDKKDSLPSTLHPPPSTRLPPPATRYYQLTHDYLVHAIREWLTRKQKETRRGRAELMLADRAGVWNARPENRQLPALVQWLQIRWYTSRKNWTPPQQQMMRKAGRYHALRGAAAAMLLAVAALAGLTIQDRVEQQRKATHADGLVQSLLNAHITQVPAIVSEMAAYRQWTDPRLRGENDKAAVKSSQKLHTGLALLPVDPGQVNYLYDRLLDAEPPEVPVIRDALAPHKNELVDRLWGVVEKPEKGKQQQRLQAACALASYDAPANAAGSARWQHASKNIVNELLAAVQKNPSHYATLLDQLRPVRASLLPPLIEAYRTKEKAQAERSFATTILTDYAGHKPGVLADLLMDADAQQFAVVLATLREHGDKALALLMGEIDRKLPADVPSSDVKREMLAKRQANAAVALLRMEHLEKVWPLLKRTPPDDPRLRSYLIHRLSPLGADARGIIKRLEEESDITIRRALVLSLGEFSEQQLPAEVRRSLLPRLKEIYGTEHDPGLHAAVEWLLRRWKQGAWLKQRNDEWAKNESERLKASRAASAAGTPPQWYVNSQGQTMVVIPGPVGFLMGSPPTEEGRNASLESQHKRHIGRTYALASTAVTVRQFRPFLRDNQLERYWPWLDQENPDNPIVFVDWHRAAVYCNWLSQQEGIPEDQWCYETNAPKLSHEKVSALVSVLGPQDALAWAANAAYLSFMMDRVPQVTALKKGYLGLRGYRLPTEAEMEYACRAGAVTSRYYGETEELLAEYGWYLENTKDRGDWSVGVKKPNDLGLFDMHGNVFTWCQESFAWDYPVPESGGRMEDEEDKVLIVSKEIRIMRGGSRESHADRLRSAYRHNVGATDRVSEFGLRPARTLRLGSFPALPPTVEGGQE